MITRELTTATGGLLLAVALTVTGCATDTAQEVSASSSAQTSSVQVVQTLPLGTAADITTAGSVASYTVGDWRPVPPDAQIIPAQGTMYSVDVTVVARTGTTTVNGFYFAARTADNAWVAPAVGAVRPGITYGQLEQGQTVRGIVAFDLAPGTGVIGVALRDPEGKQLAFWAISG